MSDKEKEIIKRSIEIDEYTPICYRRYERPEYMWEDACIMSNCTRLLRSEKDDQKLIRHIRKNEIPISIEIINYLKERSEENEERASIYMKRVLTADSYELAQMECGVSYEITREMYNFAAEIHANK